MHSLITGGAGFIGSSLAVELIRRGHKVTVIDDFSSGSARNIASLKSVPAFRLVAGSCADRSLMIDLVADCDHIFHLAAIVGVRRVIESPAAAIDSNFGLTKSVLELALDRRRPVFVASSSEVYGKGTEIPYREGQDLVLGRPTVARWAYACAKALAEFRAIACYKEKRLPIVVGRIFNAVGPRQNTAYGMVLPTFIRQALSGSEITVYGDGSQTRCFTHVSDTVAAIITLATSASCQGEIFNIGHDEEITIEALAHRVRACCESPSNIAHIPLNKLYGEQFEEIRRRVPHTEKLRAAIGWRPTMSLDETIADIVAYTRGTEGVELAHECL